MTTREQRIIGVAALLVGLFSCIAAWLALPLPPIQRFLQALAPRATQATTVIAMTTPTSVAHPLTPTTTVAPSAVAPSVPTNTLTLLLTSTTAPPSPTPVQPTVTPTMTQVVLVPTNAPLRIWHEDIAKWVWNRSTQQAGGPDIVSPAGDEELILLHGDLEGISGPSGFRWRVFQPGETICRPRGESVAARIWGGTAIQRQAYAERLVAQVAPVPDWRSQEAITWCR